MLTQGQAVSLDGGYYTSGIVVDGDDNVIYKTSSGRAVIDAFNAP